MLLQSKHFSKNYFMNMEDWVITVVDYAENEKILKQQKLFWIHKLKTCAPYNLHEWEVYAAYY